MKMNKDRSFCREKTFNPLTSKSKQFYRLLVSMKVKPSRGFIKLKEDFDLDDSTAMMLFVTLNRIHLKLLLEVFSLNYLPISLLLIIVWLK